MLIALGIWLALAGGVAALTGLTGLRRVRRLRHQGTTAWALAVPEPVPAGESPGDPARHVLLRYTLSDGQPFERFGPVPDRTGGSLRPGDKVLIWYDPADPDDVLVYGRWGRAGSIAFLAAGLLFLLAGIGLALAGH
jgi:hypothetical protein